MSVDIKEDKLEANLPEKVTSTMGPAKEQFLRQFKVMTCQLNYSHIK